MKTQYKQITGRNKDGSFYSKVKRKRWYFLYLWKEKVLWWAVRLQGSAFLSIFHLELKPFFFIMLGWAREGERYRGGLRFSYIPIWGGPTMRAMREMFKFGIGRFCITINRRWKTIVRAEQELRNQKYGYGCTVTVNKKTGNILVWQTGDTGVRLLCEECLWFEDPECDCTICGS